MVKSLFNICVAAVCQHNLYQFLAELPSSCKHRLLEFFTSHDQVKKVFVLQNQIIIFLGGAKVKKKNRFLNFLTFSKINLSNFLICLASWYSSISLFQLLLSGCAQLVVSAQFVYNLTELRFYLCDQVTDRLLEALAGHIRAIHRLTIIFCQNVTDRVSFL